MSAPAHNLRSVDDAMAEAVKSVGEIFRKHGLQLSGLMVNVVRTEAATNWAFNSSPREIPDELRIMLAESLRTSAEEVEEKL